MANNIKTWSMVCEQVKLLKSQQRCLQKLAELAPDDLRSRRRVERSLQNIAARLAELDGKPFDNRPAEGEI